LVNGPVVEWWVLRWVSKLNKRGLIIVSDNNIVSVDLEYDVVIIIFSSLNEVDSVNSIDDEVSLLNIDAGHFVFP
jgi:hypothetical protein